MHPPALMLALAIGLGSTGAAWAEDPGGAKAPGGQQVTITAEQIRTASDGAVAAITRETTRLRGEIEQDLAIIGGLQHDLAAATKERDELRKRIPQDPPAGKPAPGTLDIAPKDVTPK